MSCFFLKTNTCNKPPFQENALLGSTPSELLLVLDVKTEFMGILKELLLT